MYPVIRRSTWGEQYRWVVGVWEQKSLAGRLKTTPDDYHERTIQYTTSCPSDKKLLYYFVLYTSVISLLWNPQSWLCGTDFSCLTCLITSQPHRYIWSKRSGKKLTGHSMSVTRLFGSSGLQTRSVGSCIFELELFLIAGLLTLIMNGRFADLSSFRSLLFLMLMSYCFNLIK